MTIDMGANAQSSIDPVVAELADALVAANNQLLSLYRLADFSAVSLDTDVAISRTISEAKGLLRAETVNFTETLNKEVATHHPRQADDTLRDGHLVVPVQAHGKHAGYLRAYRSGAPFDTGDAKVLSALSNHLAVVLELGEMHDDLVRQAITQRDHDTASALAQAALNPELPTTDGVEVAAASLPARAAGGDFFAAGRTTNGIYVALGDVSGKGLPAAMIMTSALSATNSAFGRYPEGDCSGVVFDIENQIHQHLTETGMFITLAVGHIDTQSGVLTLVNRGQSPVLLARTDAAVPAPVDGPPLGVLKPSRTSGSSHVLKPGDLLVIGSDGCTDQRDQNAKAYGDEAMQNFTESNRTLSATEFIDTLFACVKEHGQERERDDDLTAIVARYVGGDR